MVAPMWRPLKLQFHQLWDGRVHPRAASSEELTPCMLIAAWPGLIIRSNTAVVGCCCPITHFSGLGTSATGQGKQTFCQTYKRPLMPSSKSHF